MQITLGTQQVTKRTQEKKKQTISFGHNKLLPKYNVDCVIVRARYTHTETNVIYCETENIDQTINPFI